MFLLSRPTESQVRTGLASQRAKADEEGPVRRFGFAYGTLPEHAEQGEERFTVEWHRTPDVISYDILSFSRPVSLAARVACPLARRLQKCFVRQSLAARHPSNNPGLSRNVIVAAGSKPGRPP
jgi:uncharacterized protein (UPF0548 family)